MVSPLPTPCRPGERGLPAAAPVESPCFLSGAVSGPEALSPSAGETDAGAAGTAEGAPGALLSQAPRKWCSPSILHKRSFSPTDFLLAPGRAVRPGYPRLSTAFGAVKQTHGPASRWRLLPSLLPAARGRVSGEQLPPRSHLAPPRFPRLGTAQPHALPEAAAQIASFNNYIRGKEVTASLHTASCQRSRGALPAPCRVAGRHCQGGSSLDAHSAERDFGIAPQVPFKGRISPQRSWCVIPCTACIPTHTGGRGP